jgi:ABC-type phosphate transport system permease subunit
MAWSMPSGILPRLTDAGTSLTVMVYFLRNETVPGNDPSVTPFALAAILLLIVFALNTITALIGAKFKKGNN